jgi:hypothetical protein
MRQIGLMKVSWEVLRDLLRLPKTTRILDALGDPNGYDVDTVTFTVESDDFPATPNGNELPQVTAEFTADDDGYPVFVQWKIE